jgi:uncharacterized membrane protein
MAFAIALFFSNILVPAVMILAGYMMYKYPPTSINGVIGYRTKRSKLNIDTWKFAHHYCGKLWLKIGVLVLLLTILIQIPLFKAGEDIIGKVSLIIAMVQVVIILCSIYPVEKALRKNFDENGNRRIF